MKQLIIGLSIAGVLILLGVLKIFMQPDQPPETATAALTSGGGVGSGGDVNTLLSGSTAQRVKQKVGLEKQRKAHEAITEHEEAIVLSYDDSETADRLMAVGNLQQYQLSDYYSAIQNYRMIVDTRMDHPQAAAQAYVEIATCYEKMGEELQAMYIYQEMVETLDPTLQHVKYAKLKLAQS